MNRKRKKEKSIRWIFFSLLSLATVFSAAKAADFSGADFLWIGNNTYESGNQSEATVGMIKIGGESFGITIEKDRSGAQLLRGEVWMGVGSFNDKVGDFSNQNDFPSLGWVRFDKNYPSFCGADKSCRPATWQRKSGVGLDSLEGYLSGWAQFELGKNGDGSDYPETWVYFKPPVNPAEFNCDSRSNLNRTKDYYACTDKNGYLFGYGWSSEAAAATIADNSGFGWINMPGISFNNCEANRVCNLNCSYDPDCCKKKEYFDGHDQCRECGMDNKCNIDCSYDQDCCGDKNYAASHQDCVSSEGFCSLYRTSPGGSGKIKVGTNVKYHISISGGLNPEKILYKCTKDDGERELPGDREADYECDSYDRENSNYEMSARYSYKNNDGSINYKECANKINITTEGEDVTSSEACSCEVLVKKANTTGEDKNEWSRSLRLDNVSEEVEARVQAAGGGCNTVEKPFFRIADAAKIEYGEMTAKFVIKKEVSQSAVSASIRDDEGKEIFCGSAEIIVRESVNWR